MWLVNQFDSPAPSPNDASGSPAATGAGWRLERGGRGRATEPRWETAAVNAEDAARCEAFLDRLEGLSRAEWLEAGGRILARSGGEPEAAARQASDALDAVITERQLGVTAWLVRDAVETVTYVASCAGDPGESRRHPAPPCTGNERASLTAARVAAERAALAHLARPWLSRAVYLTLVAPFLAMAVTG